MTTYVIVILQREDLLKSVIHIYPEDSHGNRLTAVRLGTTTTIQASSEEVSPLDLAALFDRWAQEIREQVGAPQDGVVVADFTPSGGAA
jgi:hypothetical protein